MNEKIKMFLLAGENFIPKMHLTQPKPTYSASDFPKNKNRIQNFNKTNIFIQIYLSKWVRQSMFSAWYLIIWWFYWIT